MAINYAVSLGQRDRDRDRTQLVSLWLDQPSLVELRASTQGFDEARRRNSRSRKR
ncbi:hypothetical protein [Rhodococcus sp. OK302]|uniref:hypothetical protein n=1 Tax=Rhodococcus sp. OK302 TaxID=1882769 RepID=UPI0015959DF9|nr:hypothetical protein [Rhodococcus sp. OK302]